MSDMMNIDRAAVEIQAAMPELAIYENENMSERCSFKVGGPVRALAAPESRESLAELCGILEKYGITPLPLGNCTNIIFPDEGMRETFALSTEKLTDMYMKDENLIYAGAGVSLARLAGFACQNELTGLEFASGIPGSVGGGSLMNAGAYGGELRNVIETVEIFYIPEGKFFELKNEDCRFAYRRSVFKSIPGCIITGAAFRLEKGDSEKISEKMRELNQRRRDKQPLDMPSAGSAFKRPEGYYAAALIEEAGLKGFRVGGAGVSEKHSGFVVNCGGATAADVRELMREVHDRVLKEKGVELESEIIMLPPDYRPPRGGGKLSDKLREL
ncbi:MAG: UDP-N-acetylmuramate dehydrogenase [Candidatus Limivicinus sp.]|jgi:UDP-N-acetylmuramate dehydrogenase